MDAQHGARLLAAIWPRIDLALSEENRPTRLQFISDLLGLFARNGVELSDVLYIDEDIRSCAEHLGALPAKPTFVLDSSGLDDPVDYELIGGPFDGAFIRLGAALSEMPPGLVTLTANEQPTRMDGDTVYELKEITERDSNGEPTGQYLAYEHKQDIAK